MIVFSVFVSKDAGFSVLVFNAVCGFSFFSIWFSVFVKKYWRFFGFGNQCGFWFFLFFFLFDPICVYSFVCGFRFWLILFEVLDEFFFGFAVSSIPQCPPLKPVSDKKNQNLGLKFIAMGQLFELCPFPCRESN